MKKEVIDTARTIEIEKEGEYEDLVGHLHGDSEFTGPVSKRKCTNISFLIVFIVFNIGLIGIATYILIKGSPDRLGKGFDIRANTCGIGNLKEKRFMLFPNATSLHWSLCVEACPYYYYENYYCIYDEKDPNIYYPEWGCFDAYSTTAYGFYCIPADNGRKLVMDYLENIINVVQIATGDVYRIWEIVLIGYIFSMAIGLSYLYLMRITKIARKLVMCSVYALIFLSVLVVYLLYHTGIRSLSQSCGDYGPASTNYCDKSTYTFYITISITSGVLLLIYILKISKKYSSFEMGVSMIELTSKPLRVMKELAVFPIIQIFIGSCILLLLILLIGWNLSTFTKTQISKSDIPGGYGYILEYTALEKYMLAYNAIMSIWWCNFIVDLGKFVMSGGVSTWYFSRQKSVLYAPLFVSFKFAMRYHIGSIAMGSILRIFSSIFSFFLSRISQKLKKDSVSCGKILCAKICFCYKYYNSTLRYITELNYTFLAIFADGYLESGKKAYHLMRRNYVRIGKPAKTGTFIISIMKWVVILSGVCVTLILILFPTVTPTGIHTIEITGVSGPIIFSFILSWFVGEIFGGALEVSLNTVLLSAACDEEMFVREQRFIEPDLLEFMDGIGEEQNLQHRENMKKIRVGSESTNFDHYNTDAHYEKYGIFKIVPENSWKNSSNVSRLNASTLQKNDAEENRIASANSNLRPAEIIFNRESNLEDINEVSMEEEPIFTYGIPAEYVD